MSLREKKFLQAIGWDKPADDSLFEAMADLSFRHAEQLLELGPVRVLALDQCPRCGGRVIASETEAKCTAGCDWRYRPATNREPVASRRADQ